MIKALRKFSPATATLLIGLALSAMAAWYVEQRERSLSEDAFIQMADDQVDSFFTGLQRGRDAVASLVQLHHSSEEITLKEFRIFSAPFFSGRGDVKLIGWAPHIRTTDRYPIALYAPHGPLNALETVGLGTDEAAREALERARDSGAFSVSRQLSETFSNGNGGRVLMVFPIFASTPPPNTVAERRRDIQGFMFGIIAIPETVDKAMSGVRTRTGKYPFNFTLFDLSASRGKQILFSDHPAPIEAEETPDSIRHDRIHRFGGRLWLGRVTPVEALRTPFSRGLPWVMLFGGLLASFSTAAYFLNVYIQAQRIRKAQTILRGITTTAPDAILMMDQEGRIAFWNRAAEKMFGYSGEELQNAVLHELLAPARFRKPFNESFSHFKKTGEGGVVNRVVEVQALRKDGTEFPIELSIGGIDLGSHWNAVGVIRDITRRVKNEQTLRIAERASALGSLAGGVAHELNNLLLPIHALSEMTAKRMEEGGPDRKRLDKVCEAAHKAKDLVEQIMEFSRREDVELAVMDIKTLIDRSLDLLRKIAPPNIEIKETLDPDAGQVMADIGQMESVFFHLASNSKEAMNEHPGEIKISVDCVTFSSSRNTPAPGMGAGSYARLVFSDTGCGMDAATVEHVFDPFFTTRDVGKGTGLGLSTVHAIIAAHRGHIFVSSVLGEGTTFEIYLPSYTSEH